jgi:hypothetical protein
MLTLGDIQTSRFQTASGHGTSSTEFLEMLNDVVDELIKRGDWSDTLVPVRLPINYGFITFPRWVGQIRKMKGHRDSITMRNVWWEFLDGHNRRRDWERDDWWGWRNGYGLNMEMQYRAPTFTDIPGPGNYLQFTVTETADNGATATIFGLDNNGQPLQTQNGDGTWSPGITLVAAGVYQSAGFVSTIERVVLTSTNSTKTLSAYNPSTGVTTQLAEYQASETNPAFLRYKLVGAPNFWCSGGCPKSAIALVKLAKVPILNPTDPILINNRNALLDGIRAVKLEDAGQSGATFWKSAIERLNRQLEDDSPDEQFSAQNNTWGDNRCLTNHTF